MNGKPEEKFDQIIRTTYNRIPDNESVFWGSTDFSHKDNRDTPKENIDKKISHETQISK